MAGSSAPFTDFDPLNLLDGKSVNQIKLYREAEVSSEVKRVLCSAIWAVDRYTRVKVAVPSQSADDIECVSARLRFFCCDMIH
jgi:hypothetical protein